jgi:hypothetical protein
LVELCTGEGGQVTLAVSDSQDRDRRRDDVTAAVEVDAPGQPILE